MTDSKPFRFEVHGVIPASSKPDAATQARVAIDKAVRKAIGQMGGQVNEVRVTGVGVSEHLTMGGIG